MSRPSAMPVDPIAHACSAESASALAPKYSRPTALALALAMTLSVGACGPVERNTLAKPEAVPVPASLQIDAVVEPTKDETRVENLGFEQWTIGVDKTLPDMEHPDRPYHARKGYQFVTVLYRVKNYYKDPFVDLTTRPTTTDLRAYLIDLSDPNHSVYYPCSEEITRQHQRMLGAAQAEQLSRLPEYPSSKIDARAFEVPASDTAHAWQMVLGMQRVQRTPDRPNAWYTIAVPMRF